MGNKSHGKTILNVKERAVECIIVNLCSACRWCSCRTATLDFFFDLAESKVAVFLCSILTSDGIPFCFGKNSFL